MKTPQCNLTSSCSKRQFCVLAALVQKQPQPACVVEILCQKIFKILYFFPTSMFVISYFSIKSYNFREQKITWQPIFIFQSAV